MGDTVCELRCSISFLAISRWSKLPLGGQGVVLGDRADYFFYPAFSWSRSDPCGHRLPCCARSCESLPDVASKSGGAAIARQVPRPRESNRIPDAGCATYRYPRHAALSRPRDISIWSTQLSNSQDQARKRGQVEIFPESPPMSGRLTDWATLSPAGSARRRVHSRSRMPCGPEPACRGGRRRRRPGARCAQRALGESTRLDAAIRHFTREPARERLNSDGLVILLRASSSVLRIGSF